MGLAMDQAAKDIAGAADYLAGRAEVTRHRGRRGRLLHGRLAGAVDRRRSPTRSRSPVGFYPAVPWERM